jgi:hypothetical protein
LEVVREVVKKEIYSREKRNLILAAVRPPYWSSQIATRSEKDKISDYLQNPSAINTEQLTALCAYFTPSVKMFKLARSRPFAAALKSSKVKSFWQLFTTGSKIDKI